jgi:hypothetical protein
MLLFRFTATNKDHWPVGNDRGEKTKLNHTVCRHVDMLLFSRVNRRFSTAARQLAYPLLNVRHPPTVSHIRPYGYERQCCWASARPQRHLGGVRCTHNCRTRSLHEIAPIFIARAPHPAKSRWGYRARCTPDRIALPKFVTRACTRERTLWLGLPAWLGLPPGWGTWWTGALGLTGLAGLPGLRDGPELWRAHHLAGLAGLAGSGACWSIYIYYIWMQPS